GERGPAKDRKVGEKRAGRPRERGGEEEKAQRARQHEHGGEDEHPRHEIDGLQRAEIVMEYETYYFGQADVDGESGRVRVVIGDVVHAHAEAEERFVPVPERARHGQETRSGAEEEQQPVREALGASPYGG